MPGTVRCSRGHANSEGAKFCTLCEDKMPEGPTRCKNCGATIDSRSKFCSKCGSPAAQSEEQADLQRLGVEKLCEKPKSRWFAGLSTVHKVLIAGVLIVGLAAFATLILIKYQAKENIFRSVGGNTPSQSGPKDAPNQLPAGGRQISDLGAETDIKNELSKPTVKKFLLEEARKANIQDEREVQEAVEDLKDQLLIETLLKKKVGVVQSQEKQTAFLEKYVQDLKERTPIVVREEIWETNLSNSSEILATVGGDPITAGDFNKELDRVPANMKQLVSTESGKRSFLDRLMVKKLLVKEAKKENVEKDKEFQNRLGDLKNQLLVETLLKKKANVAQSLTDEDLRKYYDGHEEEFKTGEEVNTRQIFLKTEQEARQIQSRLQKGEDFTGLAKQYSADASAKATGGEIGYHSKGTLLPEYEAAAFRLTRIGQISPIIKTQLGYHIIKLEGTKASGYSSFEEVRELIKQKLLLQRQQESARTYVEQLKKSGKISND